MSGVGGTIAVGLLTGVVMVPIKGQRQILTLAARPGVEAEIFASGQKLSPWGFAGSYINTKQSRVDFLLGAAGLRLSLVGNPMGDPTGTSPATTYSSRAWEPYLFGGAAISRYELLIADEENTLVDYTSVGLGGLGGIGCDFYWSSLGDKPSLRPLSAPSLALTTALTVGSIPLISGKFVAQPSPITFRVGLTWH